MPDESARLKLKQGLDDLDSLPAMPVIAQKLLALPLDTEEGEEQLLNLIGQDPQICAKIISMSNSPMVGAGRKINSVHDASMLLGLSRVKSVALGIASLSGMGELTPGKHFDPQDLWLHSMTVAMTMRTISQFIPRNVRPNEEQIFLAGLLHDIGFMALHHLDPEVSNELHLQLRLQPGRPILDIEQETLGMTHCYIGSQLARHWNLPPEIVAVTGHHHLPYVSEVAAGNPLVRLTSIAERVLPNFGITENTAGEIQEHEWVELGINLDEVDDICNQADELAVQAAQMGETF